MPPDVVQPVHHDRHVVVGLQLGITPQPWTYADIHIAAPRPGRIRIRDNPQHVVRPYIAPHGSPTADVPTHIGFSACALTSSSS
jgi:hypothetical protein